MHDIHIMHAHAIKLIGCLSASENLRLNENNNIKNRSSTEFAACY